MKYEFDCISCGEKVCPKCGYCNNLDCYQYYCKGHENKEDEDS